ncbi:E3 ubiquitin-protein ligase TRIM33 isoform X2 [Nematostella vectensis]|uniref:E3 ubiquitin-protein ligase TRIM33 isoform X2 n=1 Tax=Nematostella vectensis TaxID=45351 RepID=UPI001390449C|nr:E3 ubiquitin-protein ligase TRIM33 isoform X2 [Nematostella vectensis]
MAEGSQNSPTEDVDEDSVFMICGICRKSSATSNPKLLPCLHSFCFGCLEEKFDQQQQQEQKQNSTTSSSSASSSPLQRLKCPTCGQEFLVPPKGIAGFLDNQFMLESLGRQTRKKESTDRECTSCEDKSPATSYCLDCSDWLCDACVQAHQRVRVTKDHTVQTMEEYLSSSASNGDDQRPIFCSVHPHEPLKLFCGNCEKLTCRDCQLLEHKDHKYQFIRESAVSYREYLRSQLNRLYEQAQPLTESIKDVEKAARGLQEREDVITSEIHKATETLIKAVKQRESVLLTELKALVHYKHKLLAKQNKDLRLMQKILQHNYGFTRHVLKSSTDMALLYSKKQLSSRIQNLLSLKYKVNPVAHSDLKFSMDAEKMSSYIGKLGSVITPADKAVPTSSGSIRVDSNMARSMPGNIANVGSVQQHRPSNPPRTSHLDALSEASKRLVAGVSGLANNLANKLPNGQYSQLGSITVSNPRGSVTTTLNYPSGSAFSLTGNIGNIPAAKSPGQLAAERLAAERLSDGSEGAFAVSNNAPMMKYTTDPRPESGTSTNTDGGTQTLRHFLGPSPPLPRPSSAGTIGSSRASLPSSPSMGKPSGQNGTITGQGMVRNGSPVQNSYLRRPSPLKRSLSSHEGTTNPLGVRVKKEKTDSTGEMSSCTESNKMEDAGSGESGIDEAMSSNDDWCAVCRNGGELLCCDTCPRVFHLQCHIPSVNNTPSDKWSCGLCNKLDVKLLQDEAALSMAQGGNKRRSSLSGLLEWERKICEKILLELFCHSDSIPFQQKVSKSVPNYYKVITHPMDLSTIRAKIQPQHFQHYSSITEFLSDCQLIFSNCATFNDESSEVGRMGNNLELYYMSLLQKFLPENIEIPEPQPIVKPALLEKRREDAKAFIHGY